MAGGGAGGLSASGLVCVENSSLQGCVWCRRMDTDIHVATVRVCGGGWGVLADSPPNVLC
jgi:hypothetical protein